MSSFVSLIVYNNFIYVFFFNMFLDCSLIIVPGIWIPLFAHGLLSFSLFCNFLL